LEPDQPRTSENTSPDKRFLWIAVGILIVLCLWLASPFLDVITWAFALAVVANPWYAWFRKRMPANLAAIIAVVCVAIVIVAPAVVLIQQSFQEATRALNTMESMDHVQDRLQSNSYVAQALVWLDTKFNLQVNLAEELSRATGSLARMASGMVTGSVWFFTELFVTFLTLFFFFRDGALIANWLRRLSPVSEAETSDLYAKVFHAVNTSLLSNVFVKLVQGALGGLMWWMVGLPAPVLSGALTAFFALLPLTGTGFVWVPGAVYLLLQGSWIKALILALWGALVVSLVDNFLYPLLVAEGLRFHALAVFFAVFGGLIAFGLTGIVLGPVILAVAASLLDIWEARKLAGET
jgi:predicted PurR-regulated permease PerM